MKTFRVFAALGVLCLCSTAEAQSIKSVTMETSRGTAVTEVSRNGNTVTTRTTFQPRATYQPMGGNSYQPMGGGSGGGYKPMGR